MSKQIQFIGDGTVIDHIKAGEALKVLEVLKLIKLIKRGNCKVMIGCNFESGHHDAKDFIKINNAFLEPKDLNRISLLAPDATISVIRNFKIVEKYKVNVEKELNDILCCLNPSCITNFEKIPSKFYSRNHGPGVFECHYCEGTINEKELKFV
ncbi:aspartate carbamoyltransferase regulatory subunit [bacterium]|jgi:aspartate carbamoyltransferase regulatory subunit|nr:aspartate carbamoyltransferase regulatory subunit [bacterium]